MGKCTMTFEDSPDGKGLIYEVLFDPKIEKGSPTKPTPAQHIGSRCANEVRALLDRLNKPPTGLPGIEEATPIVPSGPVEPPA